MNSSISVSRTTTLYVLLAVTGAIFIGRLFFLQIIQHDHYKEQALAEHQSKFAIPAERGTISALDGSTTRPLVLNQTLPTIYADPKGVKDPHETARELAEVIGVSYEELVPKLLDETSRYQVLKHRLSLDQSKAVEELRIGGIGQVPATYRVYPQTELASQLLGFVNAESAGQYGIEEALNERLSGTDGRLKAVTDVYGIPLSTIDENIIEEPTHGEDLTLTIDVNVQRAVEDVVKDATISNNAESASAIVVEAKTGAIKAMANYPTYNPEEFSNVEDFSVFINDVVSSPYETGSGIKVFTMAAGLSEGVITKDSTYLDTGSIEVDGINVSNAVFDGEIVRSMSDVIQRSVNTGVIHILSQLGGGEINERSRTVLYDYFTDRFGFGSLTGVDQANEAKGVVFGPTEGDGLNIRYANMSFGQGMTVTMVQMAAAMSSVVNGGVYYQPYLVDHSTDSDGYVTTTTPKALRTNTVEPAVAQDLIDMMQLVVQDGGGRAAKRAGYTIGGKTGTAQVPDEFGQYSPDDTIGSFTGFLGGDEIEYVVMTRIDKPRVIGFAGTESAAPMFANISNWLIDYYQIPPK